jgi:hypothetical protein
MSSNEVVMTEDALKELVRFVVFETVTEIRKQEADAYESVQEQEEAEVINENNMRTTRTRAALLASAMKKYLQVDVVKHENIDSVVIMGIGEGQGISLRLDDQWIRATRVDGHCRVWNYDNRNEYDKAAQRAVKWLIVGEVVE